MAAGLGIMFVARSAVGCRSSRVLVDILYTRFRREEPQIIRLCNWNMYHPLSTFGKAENMQI